MAKCVGPARSCSYSSRDIVMRSTQVGSPHSQTRSSGWLSRPKSPARSLIRSFTSRKTASFSPMRSSRSLRLSTLRSIFLPRVELFNYLRGAALFLDDDIAFLLAHDLDRLAVV